MRHSFSTYDNLARLLGYLETTAEQVRGQMRQLWQGEDRRTPPSMPDVMISASQQYVRSRAVDMRRANRSRGTSGAVKERRRQTANLLAQFDARRATRPAELGVDGGGLGALVRRGYLRHKGDGYVRTTKRFDI